MLLTLQPSEVTLSSIIKITGEYCEEELQEAEEVIPQGQAFLSQIEALCLTRMGTEELEQNVAKFCFKTVLC